MSEPLDPGLFANLDPLRLAGSRCGECSTVQFPAALQCAHCAADTLERIVLPERGEVWTWTVQRFAPKEPYQVGGPVFVPFAVGYVDLGEVLVETVLLEGRQPLSIGTSVHLVQQAVPGEDDTWSFAFSA
jgi:uncharacterized OB-fold protein